MLDDPYSRNDQLLVMVKTYISDNVYIYIWILQPPLIITSRSYGHPLRGTLAHRLDQAGKAAARAVAQQRSKAAKARSKICEEVLIWMNHDMI